MENTKELVLSSNQNDKELTIKEFAKLEGMTIRGAKKKLDRLNVPFKIRENIDKNGNKKRPLAVFNYNDYLILEQKDQQFQIQQNQQTADNIVKKYNSDVVMLATGNILNNSIEKQVETFMSLGANILNTIKEQKDTIKDQDNTIKKLEEELINKDIQLKELKDIIITIEENKGRVKELQKKFVDYVKSNCEKKFLDFSAVFSDIYSILSKRYDIDYSCRNKYQSIIEYIASLNNSKKYLIELLTIAGNYFNN